MDMNSVEQTLDSFLIQIFGHWALFSNYLVQSWCTIFLLSKFLKLEIFGQTANSTSLCFRSFCLKNRLEASCDFSTDDCLVAPWCVPAEMAN